MKNEINACPCGDNCKCNPCTCGASVEGYGG